VPPPVVTALSTASQTPGRPVVITGDRFGNGKNDSFVRLRLRDVPGAQTADAPIDKWTQKRIEARVPALDAVGSGGIADLWVRTPDGESDELPFTVLEPNPPALTDLDPEEGVPGDELELTGTGFGLHPYADAGLRIDAPGGPTAPVVEWSATRIRGRLPAAAPGVRRIRVHTLWGDSGDLPFKVATAPVVAGVSAPARLDEPLSFLPGDELIVTGAGFGEQADAQSAVTIAGDAGPVEVAITDWSDGRIAALVPVDADLGAPGDKTLVVTTRWASSDPFTVTLEAPPELPPAPLAMLPLRLETRFSNDRTHLLVRAIPDAIHVDDHQDVLAADERQLGQAYLQATGDAREDAWRRLVARTGRRRALWVAEAAAKPAPPSGDPGDAWTRAARSRLLPRRLHAFAYAPGGAAPGAEAWSRPIPLELPLGPDPAAAPGDESLDEGIRWMVHFDEAVANGMGLRIALPPELRDGVGRIVVVGAETSVDERTAARELGAALRSQHHSGGLAFVPEGTPTNSTAESATGVEAPDEGAPPAGPAQPPPRGSNGWFARRAFGFARDQWDIFDDVPDAHMGDDRRCARRAMNAALWPHLRYFHEHMMVPALGAEDVVLGREHFVEWVRACGPLPVMRVGAQPYGLLPITPLGRFDAGPGHPLTRLAAFLHGKLQPVWLESAAKVPRVSDSPADARPGEQPLLTALSLQPHPVSYRVRSVLGKAFAGAAWRFMRGDLPAEAPTLDPAWWQRHDEVARQALTDAGLNWSPKLADAVFAVDYVPVPSPTVQAGGDRALPPAPNYLALFGRYGWHAIRDETYPPDPHQPRDPDAPAASGGPLLYLLMRHSLLLACAFAAGGATAETPWRGGEPEFHDIDQALDDPTAPRDEMVWDRVEARVPDAPGASSDPELAAVRGAIADLATLDVATLERITAESLSLASTRLDAWQTSLATRRLSDMRSVDPEGGVHLCAYGFVEDLAPAPARASAGYVHAPSPAHASAAAILASGYRSHADGNGAANRDGAARQPFGIDLSSERVRTALALFDGVRAGQPLGALLGYRFERGLQGRRVARFIDDFRELAPLPVAGAAPPSGAVTAVAAQNVVDGLELHRLWTAADRETPGDWPGAGNPQVEAELKALDDTLDAVSDILVNEAVFQTVRGNAARARASLEAAARPTGPPPELEAIYTPYQGTGVIHRLLALLPGDWAPAEDWYGDHGEPVPLGVRASAEPRIDAWAGRLLGDPKRVRYRIEYRAPGSDDVIAATESRLDHLEPHLGPLDVVHAAVATERGQLSEIEQRIAYQALRSRPAGVPPDARVAIVDSAAEDDHPKKIGLRELMELAQSLRETVAEAPSIEPRDLAVPDVEAGAAIATGELTTRAAGAETALRAAADTLAAAIEGDSTAEVLRAALLAGSVIGVPGTIPLAPTGDSPEIRAELRAQALVADGDLLRRISELPAPLPGDPAPDAAALREHAEARIRAVFGPAFRVLPLIATPAAPDPRHLDVRFADSEALQDDEPFAVTTWFQRLSRVRGGARRLSDTLLYGAMLGQGEDLRLRVAQLPAAARQRWIGLPFGDDDPPPARVSIVAHLPAGPLVVGAQVAGLKLEELTEVLPAREKTTGLSFHYDQPNAAAPQAILIGVPPVHGEDWTLDLMRETVEEALDIAKIRMVDLPSLERVGHFLPALYFGLNLQGVTVATDFKEGTGVRLA
jgi:hypothetical protein